MNINKWENGQVGTRKTVQRSCREGNISCNIFLFFMLGNGLVLFVYIKDSSLRTPSNRLLISLTMADILMMSKSWVLVVNAWYNGPVLGMPGNNSYFDHLIKRLV